MNAKTSRRNSNLIFTFPIEEMDERLSAVPEDYVVFYHAPIASEPDRGVIMARPIDEHFEEALVPAPTAMVG